MVGGGWNGGYLLRRGLWKQLVDWKGVLGVVNKDNGPGFDVADAR